MIRLTLKQCMAHKPNGERCLRVAKGDADFCSSHKRCAEEKLPAIQPLPCGMVRLTSIAKWATCEQCGEHILDMEAIVSEDGKTCCRPCFVSGIMRRGAHQALGQTYIPAFQAETMAHMSEISYDALELELFQKGFTLEAHSNYLFFVRTEAEP